VEYYFGYQLPENDLVGEDWRSRDRSWDYCRIALGFFRDAGIPFQDMTCRDDLVGNAAHDNSRYCLAKEGEIYLVYLPEGGRASIELPGRFQVRWFNPRDGGYHPATATTTGALEAPGDDDWLAVIRK
jgi:hypothetical protein